MKIISSGKSLHTSEFHAKRARMRKFRRLIGLFVLILIIGLPIYLSRLPKFIISNIEVEGASVVKADDIIQIASTTIRGNYAGIWPRANSFIYPSNAMEDKLMKDLPRLRSAAPTLVDGRTLKIYVEERAPYALYCTDITKLPEAAGCYFLDDSGFIFDNAPAFSGDVYFIYAKEDTGTEAIGTEYLPVDDFKLLDAFIKDLAPLGIYPRAFEMGGGEYHLILPNGGRIIWNKADPLTTIQTNLEAFFSSDAIRSDSRFLDKILYLDLRTENKVFYKFQ